MFHDFVAWRAVFIHFIGICIGNGFSIIGYITKGFYQTAVFKSTEESGYSHPVVIGFFFQRTFILLQFVNHYIPFAYPGKVPVAGCVLGNPGVGEVAGVVTSAAGGNGILKRGLFSG